MLTPFSAPININPNSGAQTPFSPRTQAPLLLAGRKLKLNL